MGILFLSCNIDYFKIYNFFNNYYNFNKIYNKYYK